jgi:NDP-sugar pyrophosphorylase family protein
MRAGILAAGHGERLRDSGKLKPLVEIAGRPLVAHVLNAFREIEAEEVTIIINEDATAVREIVSAEKWPFPLHWIIESTPSSMHSFLRLVQHLAARGNPDAFMIATVDTIVQRNELARFYEAARTHSASAVTLAVNRPAEDDNPLWVTAEAAGRVLAFGDAATGRATAGVYIVSPAILREAEAARRDGLMSLRSFLGRLLARGYEMSAVPIGNSVDVDRSADIIAAEKLLQQNPT